MYNPMPMKKAELKKKNCMQMLFMYVCVCVFKMTPQQLRSYGDGAMAESLICQTGQAGDRTSNL